MAKHISSGKTFILSLSETEFTNDLHGKLACYTFAIVSCTVLLIFIQGGKGGCCMTKSSFNLFR